MLGGIDEVVLFFGAVAAFLAIIESSFRLGRRHRECSDDTAKAHVGALQDALLGLLAFIWGSMRGRSGAGTKGDNAPAQAKEWEYIIERQPRGNL
jgi:hypothetical protein